MGGASYHAGTVKIGMPDESRGDKAPVSSVGRLRRRYDATGSLWSVRTPMQW